MTGEADRPDDWEIAPGFAHDKLQGSIPALATDDDIRGALEKAFDYRGDVTITRKDGHVVEGYIYDRRHGQTLASSLVRVLPSNGSPRVSIPYTDIVGLAFSGRDTAAGKSWEAWVRKYWEKKGAGETAVVEVEELE